MDEYALLLEDENRVIFETRKLRREIIDNYIKKRGLPTDSKTMEAFNKILDSLDKQVLDMVNVRQKAEELSTNASFIEIVKDVFNKVRNESTKIQPLNNPELPDIVVPDNIVPGEDSLEYEEIELEEIMKKVEK